MSHMPDDDTFNSLDSVAVEPPTKPTMKGGISLSDFIKEVESELFYAQATTKRPVFELGEATLDVTFSLDTSAKGGTKLLVFELGGEAKAQQIHKVSLKLRPLTRKQVAAIDAVRHALQGGGGGGHVQPGSGGGGTSLRKPLEARSLAANQGDDPLADIPAVWFAPASTSVSEPVTQHLEQAVSEAATPADELLGLIAEELRLLEERPSLKSRDFDVSTPTAEQQPKANRKPPVTSSDSHSQPSASASP